MFHLFINTLRDIKTKMLSFQHKNSFKGHQRSHMNWYCIENFISLGVLFVWIVSYLYQKVYSIMIIKPALTVPQYICYKEWTLLGPLGDLCAKGPI